MAYPINQDFIRFGQSRSGTPIQPVRFIVAHDTGNPSSTAKGNRDYFDRDQPEASAHAFVDDTQILETVPLTEKAWHVRYAVPEDNTLYGGDADDCAIGVELCYGGKINFAAAYARYVWYLAYLCDKFKLQPRKHIVGHSKLDPKNKIDPENGLSTGGKTFTDLINDVDYQFQAMQTQPGAGFPDVPADAWYADAVVQLKGLGVATGDEQGNFRPGDTITRAEAAVMLRRLFLALK